MDREQRQLSEQILENLSLTQVKKNKLPNLEGTMANLKFCIEHCGMNDEEIEEMQSD